MDNKGSSTIEITIALVIIVLILAVIVNSSEIATKKISKITESQSSEVKLAEICDYLINNPGDYNWIKYKKTPGLAIVTEAGTIPNSVSYSKFIALGSDYDEFADRIIFDGKVKSSIELIPLESSISSVKIGHDEEPGNVYSQNRLVKCDFFKKYVIKDFQNQGKCNHNHDNETHSCNYFKIFKGNLKKSDYYLLIDSDEKHKCKYFIDTTQKKINNWGEADEETVYINDRIEFSNDTSAIVFVHFDKKNVKASIVSVPKDFSRKNLKYDYFRTNNCELIMKAWY